MVNIESLDQLILGKDKQLFEQDGSVFKGKLIEEIEVRVPILNLFGSKHNPLKYRENLIPSEADAFYLKEIKTSLQDPFQVGITDYREFRIKFYKRN